MIKYFDFSRLWPIKPSKRVWQDERWSVFCSPFVGAWELQMFNCWAIIFSQIGSPSFTAGRCYQSALFIASSVLCSWVSQRYKGNFDFVRPIQITTAVFQFRQQLKTSCFFLRTSKDRGFLKMLVYVSFLTLDDRTIQTCPKSLCEFRRSSSRSSKSCSRLPSVYGSLCLSQKSGNHILIWWRWLLNFFECRWYVNFSHGDKLRQYALITYIGSVQVRLYFSKRCIEQSQSHPKSYDSKLSFALAFSQCREFLKRLYESISTIIINSKSHLVGNTGWKYFGFPSLVRMSSLSTRWNASAWLKPSSCTGHSRPPDPAGWLSCRDRRFRKNQGNIEGLEYVSTVAREDENIDSKLLQVGNCFGTFAGAMPVNQQ